MAYSPFEAYVAYRLMVEARDPHITLVNPHLVAGSDPCAELIQGCRAFSERLQRTTRRANYSVNEERSWTPEYRARVRHLLTRCFHSARLDENPPVRPAAAAAAAAADVKLPRPAACAISGQTSDVVSVTFVPHPGRKHPDFQQERFLLLHRSMVAVAKLLIYYFTFCEHTVQELVQSLIRKHGGSAKQAMTQFAKERADPAGEIQKTELELASCEQQLRQVFVREPPAAA